MQPSIFNNSTTFPACQRSSARIDVSQKWRGRRGRLSNTWHQNGADHKNIYGKQSQYTVDPSFNSLCWQASKLSWWSLSLSVQCTLILFFTIFLRLHFLPIGGLLKWNLSLNGKSERSTTTARRFRCFVPCYCSTCSIGIFFHRLEKIAYFSGGFWIFVSCKKICISKNSRKYLIENFDYDNFTPPFISAFSKEEFYGAFTEQFFFQKRLARLPSPILLATEKHLRLSAR